MNKILLEMYPCGAGRVCEHQRADRPSREPAVCGATRGCSVGHMADVKYPNSIHCPDCDLTFPETLSR